MREIGLFFGSFNPIHNGHLMLATYCKEHCGLDEINFVVSPQNPFKENKDLIPFDKRMEMIMLTIKHSYTHYGSMRAVNWENLLPKPSYTYNTLEWLSSNMKHSNFHIIMGLDNWENITKWKNFEQIVSNYPIIVYPRLDKNNDSKLLFNSTLKDLEVNFNIKPNVRFLEEAPLSTLSSTFIRGECKNNKEINFYVPNIVNEYIKYHKLYVSI